MKQLSSLLVITASAAFAQPPQPFSGAVSGILKGEDGTLIAGGAILLHLTRPPTSKFVQQRTDWSAATAAGGVFQFTGLPEGTYTVCPHVRNSTWLGPCEWNLPTPTATISRSSANASVTITLKRGAAVPIRIDDAGQLLTRHEGRTPGAGLLLSVSGPGLFFRLVPLVSQDSNGRNYQIVIPFGTALTLVVHPSFYHVNNASGVALSQGRSTKIPLLVGAGQQVPPFTFTISGAGP